MSRLLRQRAREREGERENKHKKCLFCSSVLPPPPPRDGRSGGRDVTLRWVLLLPWSPTAEEAGDEWAEEEEEEGKGFTVTFYDIVLWEEEEGCPGFCQARSPVVRTVYGEAQFAHWIQKRNIFQARFWLYCKRYRRSHGEDSWAGEFHKPSPLSSPSRKKENTLSCLPKGETGRQEDGGEILVCLKGEIREKKRVFPREKKNSK